MKRLSRRTFVLGGLATAGAVALPLASAPRPQCRSRSRSVSPPANRRRTASCCGPGWPRRPLNADGQGGMANADVDVEWQVSTDRARSPPLVASGTVTAALRRRALACTSIAGGLAPGRRVLLPLPRQGHLSPGRPHPHRARAVGTVGRAWRWPSPRARTTSTGYFTAYRRLAEDQPGPDPAPRRLHYEYGGATHPARRPRDHVGPEIVTLADYRQRHAQYKTDPDLQAAHAVAPWLVVPTTTRSRTTGPTRSARQQPGVTAAAVDRRGARRRSRRTTRTCRCAAPRSPRGNDIQLYRRVRWGQLATFHMLDTRQFRDDQACGDGYEGLRRRGPDPPQSMHRRGAGGVAARRARPAPAAPGTSSASRCSSPARRSTPSRRGTAWTPGTATAPPGPRIQQGWVDARGAQPGRAHRRRARALGQRPQGRLRQPDLGDDRHRAGLHARSRSGGDGAGADRDPRTRRPTRT